MYKAMAGSVSPIVKDVLVESCAEEVPVVLFGSLEGTVTAGHDDDVRRFGGRELDAFEEVLEFVVGGGE